MLKENKLKPQLVNEIHEVGAYIKVLSSEGKFRLIVMRQGQKILDSDVYAGFELTPPHGFDLVQLISETEQDVRMWVSAVKMSYDAMGVQPNRSQSFVVDHFGLSQKLLPFDPSQARAMVVMDNIGMWVGGEGVDAKSGIYIAPNTQYTHQSAAPLYAYITNEIKYQINPQASVFSNRGLVSSPADISALSVFESVITFNTLYSDARTCIYRNGVIERYSGFYKTAPSKHGVIAYKNKMLGVLTQSSFHEIASFNHEQVGYGTHSAQGDAVICGRDGSTNFVAVIDTTGVKFEAQIPDVGDIYSISFDPYTEGYVLTTSIGLHSLDAAFQNTSLITAANGGTINQITFSEHYIAYSSNVDRFVIKRSNSEKINASTILPLAHDVMLIGDQLILTSPDSIAYSYDMANATIVESAVSLNRGMFRVGENLLVSADDSSEFVTRLYALSKDMSKPVTSVRVLKESY
ncbi:hypothetical protein [Pseudoalteromonas maricaloris]|uniref:hypothetical protein n=1 Tax=Pseudoalteromonas maricaloris TaxID=184924 RepID=UPI00057FB018|nr:hypothetical protein [Pseudoalteromonas flavipulchra]KID38046.1 hypothetical protein QT15_04570 [Pseudoalteromonas flavipulchra NCIMB 2033 = ATCC BAA-314]MBD0782786.1 hypothetical protein [Pseudoalteromonas flavipulchra]MBE0372377.1 hypothetical protein [Pseudoalteromonas flavipulchra NCIMB 2033 = ATCC BAA-314]